MCEKFYFRIQDLFPLVGVFFIALLIWPQEILANKTRPAEAPNGPAVVIDNPKWAAWILFQVNHLPAMKAVKTEALIVDEQRNAMRKPLYNPEISFAYTEKDEEEVGLNITQTIDWHDKGVAKTRLGEVNFELSLLNHRIIYEKKLAEALYAYIDYVKELELLRIARQQEKLLAQLSEDLSLRQQFGDVGNIDAELAYLSLSQNLQRINLGEIRYRKALLSLGQYLNSQKLKYRADDGIWNNQLNSLNLAERLENALTNQLFDKQIEQSQAQAQIAQLEGKSNPSLGVGAGRDGNENTFSFEVSIPLNIRNDFSAEYRASKIKIRQSELLAAERKRLLEKEIQQAFKNYQDLTKRLIKWQKLTDKRVSNSKKMLVKLWQSGDMSTSDYLFSLQQRSDALIASIELKTEVQKAWVDWLLISDQVADWLTSISQS